MHFCHLVALQPQSSFTFNIFGKYIFFLCSTKNKGRWCDWKTKLWVNNKSIFISELTIPLRKTTGRLSTWVHSDEDPTRPDQADLSPLKGEFVESRRQSRQDGQDLLSDHGQHLNVYTVKLIKTTPGTCLERDTNAHIHTYSVHELLLELKCLHGCSSLHTWARPEYMRPIDLKSNPSEQLTTITYMPKDLPRSLTVSVFPVPAGPLGEPPRCRCSAVVRVM